MCCKGDVKEGDESMDDIEKDRKCTDVLWVGVFAMFWVGMVVVAIIGFTMGKPNKLIYAVSQAFIDCYLKTFRQPLAPAHDVVAIMYLVRPDLFTTKAARVEVELQGTLTRGMSVADWKGRWQKPMNCEVLMTVDISQFVAEFVAAIRRLP